MGRVSTIAFAGLVAIQGYSLEAAATPAAKCPFLGPGTASGDPGRSVSGSAVGNLGGATRKEGTTPTLTTPALVLSPDGRLSVDIAGVSLECVLQELGRQGEITVRVKRPTADDAVWRRFRDLSLPQGVRRLLHGKSYRLLHAGPANSGDASQVAGVLDILVLRSGSGRFGSDEEFADTAARDRPPADVQNVPDPTSFANRAARLERLAKRNMARFSDILLRMLRRDDIDGLEGQQPADVLAAMITSAPTARLRRKALTLLTEISEELSFGALTQAIGDPDPAISGLAEELYAGLRMDAVVDAVERAVQDDDWRIRYSALATLEEMQEFAPVGQLAALAANDPNPKVRMHALELLTLGDRQAAIDHLELAFTDPNPNISELAEVLLRDLEQDQS